MVTSASTHAKEAPQRTKCLFPFGAIKCAATNNTIHNKIEMKRTVKYKLGKGFALNIRVKPFYIVKVSSSVSRSLIRFNR